MLQWAFCVCVLLAEMVVCTVVIVPLPLKWRKVFLQKLSDFWNNYPRARIVTKTCLGIVGLFFIDSIRSLYLVTTIVDPIHPAKPDELNLRTFASQRNAFLTGFILFVFFLLSQFESMLADVILLEKRVLQMNTKYEQQDKEIRVMLKERELHADLLDKATSPTATTM